MDKYYHYFEKFGLLDKTNIDVLSYKKKVIDDCLKSDLLISCINRNGNIIIPSGLDSIEVGDTVMIVTTHTGFQDIQDILR